MSNVPVSAAPRARLASEHSASLPIDLDLFNPRVSFPSTASARDGKMAGKVPGTLTLGTMSRARVLPVLQNRVLRRSGALDLAAPGSHSLGEGIVLRMVVVGGRKGLEGANRGARVSASVGRPASQAKLPDGPCSCLDAGQHCFSSVCTGAGVLRREFSGFVLAVIALTW
ncbi:hypothetical protein BD413DRAFT_240904 [Trametes elegans]|nr:hypothetical protein BD413DRAFT_240904 [Trametes elegans]